MTEIKTEKTKNTFPDRANLTPEQSMRLDNWVEQVKKSTQGAIRVSKSDLVNYFLETLPNELTEEQIIKLEIKFYDETKWLNWATKRIKDSTYMNSKVTLEILLMERKQRWRKYKNEYKQIAKQKYKINKQSEIDINIDGTDRIEV